MREYAQWWQRNTFRHTFFDNDIQQIHRRLPICTTTYNEAQFSETLPASGRQYLTCRVSENVFSTSANLSAFQSGTMTLFGWLVSPNFSHKYTSGTFRRDYRNVLACTSKCIQNCILIRRWTKQITTSREIKLSNKTTCKVRCIRGLQGPAWCKFFSVILLHLFHSTCFGCNIHPSSGASYNAHAVWYR